MTPEDWERIGRRPPWQEAPLHDLRTRYAALLLEVAEHRRALTGFDHVDADRQLWSVLWREGFGNV